MPLKLVRRHGSAAWYIRGTVRGVRVDESTGLLERKAAQEVLVKRGAEVQERAIHGDRAARTFAEAALAYMSAVEAGDVSAGLLARLGRSKLVQVGQDALDEAAMVLYPAGSPATRNRHVYTPALAVMHYAARRGWCPKPAVRRPKQPPGRVRWISYGEADRLIAAASPHLRPLVIFLLSTGCRAGEAMDLEWPQVDLSGAHVVFLDTKNTESRGTPLHPRAVAALASLAGRDGRVFRRPDGEPYSEAKGGGGLFKTAWAGMCRRAQVKDFTPHDCRHTWATWHYAANRDIAALMQLGGWKSVAMVMRYVHANTQHLAHTTARVWGTGEEQPSRLLPQSGAAVHGPIPSKTGGQG